MAAALVANPRRILALLAVALLVLVPLAWVVWSATAASVIAQSNRDQSEALASLQARLSALAAGSNGAQANAASVYLPGKSPAIAGAALQRVVANTVQIAGGTLAQSEIARSETPEAEPGAVNLRVEFNTDIVGLQRIIFALETGAPILMVQSLTVATPDAAGTPATESPALNVILLVRGYWEA